MSNVNENSSDGWEETTLGELVDFTQGFQVSTVNQFFEKNEGFVRFVRIVDYTNENEEPRYIKNPGERYSVIEDDLVMIRYGSQTAGKIVRGISGIIANNTFKITPTNYIDKEWLYWFLNQPMVYKTLNKEQSSSTMPAVTFSQVGNLIINIPPLPEQKAIANILTAFDDKIELLQQQNQTLETIAQTIFKQWFGKYQLGDELPDGWRVETIDSLVELIIDYRGKTPKKLGFDWSETGIPALSAKTIKKGKIVRRDAMNLGSEELYSIWMKDELQKGDILLTSEAPLGEMYYLSEDIKYILSQRLFALRVNKNITSEYLYHYLFSRYGQHLLNARASGSTVEGIRQTELRKIEVIIPEEKSLKKASEIFKSVFEKTAINDEQIESLTKTRDTLLPKLMSGQVRVKM